MTAKEMAIDLNMKITTNNDKYLRYGDIYNDDLYVEFDKENKVVYCNQTYDYNFDIPMLKFINKQIEELGWLDD